MSEEGSVAEFVRRAAETVVWCSRPGPDSSAEALRPPTLPGSSCFADRANFQERYERYRTGGPKEQHRDWEKSRDCVEKLVLERRRLLGASDVSLAWPREVAQRGRFLMIPAGDTLFTEAMGPGSDGFFDLDGDLPPGSTWITYHVSSLESYRRRRNRPGSGFEILVCWVPPAWIDAAWRGMQEDELGMASLWPADDPERMARRALGLIEGRRPADPPWTP